MTKEDKKKEKGFREELFSEFKMAGVFIGIPAIIGLCYVALTPELSGGTPENEAAQAARLNNETQQHRNLDDYYIDENEQIRNGERPEFTYRNNSQNTLVDPPQVGEGTEYYIKGNISFTTGEKIYHLPGQEYYDETVIDESKGERWFRSEEEAQAAGWRRSEV